MRTLSGILLGSLLCGCASNLDVYRDSQGTASKIAGVPFRQPELYVREGIYKKASKGGNCDPSPFVEIDALPLGPLYYANIDSAEFAKSGFAIKFNDKGSVSEISMNTEPSSGDALKNAGELIKAVAPIVGIGAAAAPLTGPDPACDAGPANVKYTRFSEWQAARP